MNVNNPVVRGFWPDPSVCKANGKYYLACSSFQYFPGVPIFESDDLVNWKLIGHCLTRPSQVNLHKVNSSGGVFAPTIRYHEGRFYMVTNNNTFQKNFYVWTDDIYGEWSEPIFVDQDGIDPSLFFEDGKAYFTTNGTFNGKNSIMQSVIDIETGEKLEPEVPIWSGNGGKYIESPHLYHFGDWYYLTIAEGGTEYGHMITYARSKNPMGPFEGYPKNPVLSNKDLGGNENRIQGIGHGDFVQDDEGNTFVMCLGFRQIGEWLPFHHLGRETFLAGVTWDEDGWFTCGQDGKVFPQMDVPGIKAEQRFEDLYDISLDKLPQKDPRWCYMRDYNKDLYEFKDGSVVLTGSEVTLEEAHTPTFLGVRQCEFNMDLSVKMTTKAAQAGVTVYMDESEHYDLEIRQSDQGKKAVLKLRTGDAIGIAGEVALPVEQDTFSLKVTSDHEWYYFGIIQEGTEISLGKARTKYLSTEVAGGFTGVLAAMYVIDAGGEKAEFTEFTLQQEIELTPKN